MGVRLALAVGAAILVRPAAAQVYKMPGVPDPMPVYTVSTVPTTAAAGAVPGALIYVSDCRAIAAGLTTQAQTAGNGTGCLATYSPAGVWQVAGTNITVAK